jgi:hypothetical protein
MTRNFEPLRIQCDGVLLLSGIFLEENVQKVPDMQWVI